jgi:hypothetical protein
MVFLFLPSPHDLVLKTQADGFSALGRLIIRSQLGISRGIARGLSSSPRVITMICEEWRHAGWLINIAVGSKFSIGYSVYTVHVQ